MPLYNFRRDTLISHTGVVVKAGTENYEINWPKGCPAPTQFDAHSAFYPVKKGVKEAEAGKGPDLGGGGGGSDPIA